MYSCESGFGLYLSPKYATSQFFNEKLNAKGVTSFSKRHEIRKGVFSINNQIRPCFCTDGPCSEATQQLCKEDDSEELCDNYCGSEAAAQLSMSGVIPTCHFVTECYKPYYCKCKDRIDDEGNVVPQFVDIDGECVDAIVRFVALRSYKISFQMNNKMRVRVLKIK